MSDNHSWAEKRLEYLRLAEEARHSAQRAKDPTAKLSFEMLANGWQQLAEHCEAFYPFA